MAPPGRTDPRRGTFSVALVVVAVLAAAAAVDPHGLHPFTTLRWPLVAGSVLGAAALVWHRRRLPTAVVALGAAFLGWMALAAALADDGAIPWLGHPQRHLGVLAWVVCAAAFAVGTALDGRGRAALGAAACAGSALVGLGALFELGGVAVAGADFPGLRTGGLVGQPAFLGALGVLLVPVAVGVASARADVWRWVAWGSAALGVVGVVSSQTRGAWVGLVVAGALGWWRVRRTHPGSPLLAAAGLFVLAVVVAASPLGPRALSSIDLADGSARGRVDEWRLAASVIVDHPVVGVGPEGYRLAAPEHISADYSRRYGREVVVDRAHDGLLDVAAAGGLPAGALYVALLGVVGVRLWRARRDASPVVAGAAVAAIAYGVQQLVLFPVAELDPVAWMVAGVAVAATVASPPRRPRRRVASQIVPVAVAALAVAMLVLGALDVAADRRLAAAEDALAEGRPVAALDAADDATRLRPDSIDAWYVAARVAASGPSLVDLDVALARVGSGLERSPRDPALLDLEEGLLVDRAVRSGRIDDLERAQAAVGDRRAADPTNPRHDDLAARLRRGGGR